MAIIGIAFPFNKGETSFPDTREDEAVIEDNVRRILQNRRGDRVMRPNAGSDTLKFVFENLGPLLQSSINREVRRALGAGEPRIRVLRVVVGRRRNKKAGGYEVLVLVVYRVHGDIQQTVLAFPGGVTT